MRDVIASYHIRRHEIARLSNDLLFCSVLQFCPALPICFRTVLLLLFVSITLQMYIVIWTMTLTPNPMDHGVERVQL